MLDIDTIQVMGRGTNVDFVIDDAVPFEIAVRNLREYLSECRGLYSRGTISVNVGRRILVAEQLSGIKQILDKESGLTVSRYWCSPEILEDAISGNEPSAALGPPPDATAGQSDPPNGTAVAEELGPQETEVQETTAADAVTDPIHIRMELEDRPSLKANKSSELTPLVEPEVESAPTDLVPEKASPLTAAQSPNLESLLEDDSADENSNPKEEKNSPSALKVPTDTERESAGPELKAAEPESDNPSYESTAHPRSGDAATALDFNRGNEALIIKTTCRSGEVIRYPGDVVVLADVNPGAEIIADGDIVVFGALRGHAHAGAGGDVKSTIVAMNMESHRLQIGPHIGVAPRSARQARPNRAEPKIAYVRRRSIFVAPFVRRYEEYQGGVLYEG